MLYLWGILCNIYNCFIPDNDIGTDDGTISDHVQAEKKTNSTNAIRTLKL